MAVAVSCLWGQPRFRAQSTTVVVDVTVTDGKGRAAPDLTRDDFRIFENNQPQAITAFEAPRSPAGSSGAASSEGQPRAAPRFVAIVLDRADLEPVHLKTAVDAAAGYVAKTSADDVVSVFSIGVGLETVVPFTNEKERVIAGIRKLGQAAPKGVQTASDRTQAQSEIRRLAQAENRASNPAIADLLRAERLIVENTMWMQSGFQARAMFVALRAIAQSCAPLPGHKTLILFSQGFPPTEDGAIALAAVIDAANRANVTIHVVDPSGLAGQGPATLFSADQSTNTVTPTRNNNGGRTRRNTPESVNEQMSQIAQMAPGDVHGGSSKFDWSRKLGLDREHDDLAAVASQTGGMLIKDHNRIGLALEDIDRDLGATYTLAYQPKEGDYDGAFRSIRVTLDRKGYRVRHRKGYWAIPPGDQVKVTPAAAQLLAMAASGTLHPRFTPKLYGALLFGVGGDFALPLSIVLPGDLSSLTKSDRNYTADVTVVLTVRDREGALLDVTQRSIRLNLPKEQAAEFQCSGVRVATGLIVPRLESVDVEAIVQYSNGTTGFARRHLDAGATGMRPTSLFLTDSVLDGPSTAMVDHPALESLQVEKFTFALPRTLEFERGARLTSYFGVEGISLSRPASDLELKLVLRQGERLIGRLPAPSLFASPKFPDRLLCLAQFDTRDLPAGDYLLEATVTDRKLNTAEIQRAAFRIQ